MIVLLNLLIACNLLKVLIFCWPLPVDDNLADWWFINRLQVINIRQQSCQQLVVIVIQLLHNQRFQVLNSLGQRRFSADLAVNFLGSMYNCRVIFATELLADIRV